MGVLPDRSLLPGRCGQPVLEPEDDQTRQTQQLHGTLDEGLDEDVAHEEGGGLWRRSSQGVHNALGVVQELTDLIQE